VSCFWRHNFTQWKDIERNRIVYPDQLLKATSVGKDVVGDLQIVQERRCTKCNAVELRAAAFR
jgi:hypothetical protein